MNKSMPIPIILLFQLFLNACGGSDRKYISSELIADASKQDSIFKNLIQLTNDQIPEAVRKDSLSFLILPVQASCPSCRKKTIDSILKHQNNLIDGRYIIITAGAGKKTINSYFLEQGKDVPVIENRLFLDSINLATKFALFKDNPSIYYTAGQKAYKKVLTIPATVRQDLYEFFSGRPVAMN